MTTLVSLFRGINVGSTRKVPMAELKKLHEALGLKNVTTYINSGNVVFTSDNTDLAQLTEQLEESFAETFGFRSNVMLRTTEQLNKVIESTPFQNQPEKAPNWILVFFLATSPVPTAEEDLRRAYGGPEEFHIIGQEMYLYYPEGLGRSKLTNVLIERKLQTAGTGRNWNTILQLQKMMLNLE